MSVEYSYIIRRNVITFNPESKWASATAIPIHVCTAYQGEEEYNGFYVSKQNSLQLEMPLLVKQFYVLVTGHFSLEIKLLLALLHIGVWIYE